MPYPFVWGNSVADHTLKDATQLQHPCSLSCSRQQSKTPISDSYRPSRQATGSRSISINYALSFCMGKQCCRPHPQERMQHSYNTRVAWLPVWGELGPDPCLEGREGQMPDLHVLSQHLTSLTTDPSTGCCHQW